ncbi:hypothetical protein OSTOST_13784, partial [Ostertagia ostertagi]
MTDALGPHEISLSDLMEAVRAEIVAGPMSDKPKGGRPTDYRPEYCERVIQLGREGASKAEMAFALGVSKTTLNSWAANNPEFLTAVNEAVELAQGWWEHNGKKAVFGEVPGFNATAFIFTMKNRFPDDWREKTQQEISGPNGGAIPIAAVERIPTAEAFLTLLEPARDKGAFGGRGSGKSHFFAGLMVEDCLAAPGEIGEGMRALCIREIQKDLTQSAKALIEGKLASLGLGEADGFKCFRDVIATPGDGIIIFKGMNDYSADSVKSLEGFRRAWWEEAHTATARSISLLRPTMRAAGAQMWWSWNPQRKVDPVDVMLRGPERPTGAVVVQANWKDNPWFTPELEQERQD